MSRPTLGTAVFLLLLVVAALFSLRVFSYYHKIVSGTLKPEEIPDLSFANQLTTSAVAKASAANTDLGAVESIDDDPTLGAADAKLQIIEFADFGCPYSAEVSHSLRRLATEYPSLIRYTFRDFPLIDLHPAAEQAAIAGNCAAEQKNFWAYHDKLFAHQDDLAESSLIRYAGQIGLDERAFKECLRSGAYEAEVAQDLDDGQAAGVYGTPTFFLNGVRVEGAIPESTWNQIIRAFL